MISGEAVRLRDRAMIDQRQGRHREAIANLDQAISLAPEWSEAWQLRGQILLGCAACREALASFDRALMSHPHDADTLAYRGDALRLLRQHSEALAAYRQATDLKRNHARALNGMGLIAIDRGQWQAALAYHDKVPLLRSGFRGSP